MKTPTDQQVAEWAARHDLPGSLTDLRAAMDAASSITPDGSVPRLVGPFEAITFKNGLQVCQDGNAGLMVMAHAKGVHRISILPRSDSSCRIEPLGTIRSPNAEASDR